MAKSIRISDTLYEMAQAEAIAADRSLAQQLEHWAKLGCALEHEQGAGVRQVAQRFQQAAHDAAVRAGQLAPEALYAIPSAVARSARIVEPAGAFVTGRKSW